jgi:hypothetical protein
MIEKLDSSLFDWQLWRARNVADLLGGYRLRFYNIDKIRDNIKRYAVGYCDGSELMCRPKENHIALMCFVNNEHFWFHLRKEEFNEIFKSV